MTIDELFAEIHSLHVREAIRRFQPKYTLVLVSPIGDIVETSKHKVVPEFSEIGKRIKQNPGCGAFVASGNMYPTREELEQKILSLANTLKKRMSDTSPRPRGLVGGTYYGGGDNS